MTPNTILLGLAAGLISAIVFVSATTGPVLARAVFFFLTPLAMYLAGLGLGPAAAAIAGTTATLAILLLSNPVAALVFCVSEALPAVQLSRLALLARDDSGAREWFPPGRLIVTAAVFGGLSAALILVLMGGTMDTLTTAMRKAVETFVKTELPGIPGAPAVGEEQIPPMAETALRLLPGVLALSAMATMLLNLWIAGRITLASGRLSRPWPDLASLALPASATFGLLIALALSFPGGLGGLVAGGFAGAYVFAFVLMGLAVAHYVTRGSPWRGFTLSALYLTVVIYSLPATLILALIGLGETLFGYRAAMSRDPPPGHS